MMPIAPAEALLAVIGVRPIVSHAIEVITPAQLQRAGSLGGECYAIGKSMVAGTLDNLDINDFERIYYSQTLRDLTTPYLPEQVEAMITALPPEMDGLHAEFVQLAKKAFEYLYSQFPITLRRAVGADNNTRPPRRLISRFESLLWAVDHPLGVFNLMQNATLSTQQNGALHELFPTLCRHIETECIPDALEDARIKSPRFQMQRRTESGVKRFLGRLQVAPDLAKVLQSAPPDLKPQKTPGGKPSGILATQTAPRTEKIEQGASP